MINLRSLEEKDAPFMLEWMHDKDIQKSFVKKLNNMNLQDAMEFCKHSNIPDVIHSGSNLHFAIVEEDDDEYLGTISLKDIDLENMSAEYAVSTRRKAHGKGIAKCSTDLVLKKAFNDYGLNRVYLNVYSDNTVAIQFYEKYGFKFEGEFRECIKKEGRYVNLRWYSLLKKEFNELMFGGGGAQIINRIYICPSARNERMVA